MSIDTSRSALIKSWRFAPAIGFAAALLLLVVGIVAGLYEDALYRAQKLQEVEVQARILADTVSASLIFDDPKAAQGYVAALSENPEVLALGVYNVGGERVAGFVREGAEPLPTAVSVRPSYLKDRLVYATVAVMQNEMPIGFVHVREATDTLERRVVRYAGVILVVSLSVLIMLTVGFAQLVLSRANKSLTSQAAELSEANRKLHNEMEERSRAEQTLRQVQKMEAVGNLSGGIAHDFNNLITIAKGNLQLMQRRIASGKNDIERHLAAVTESLEREATLTQRILAFARQQPLAPKSVNLSELAKGTMSLLAHSLGQDIRIEQHLDADWWCLCDANQMENVILNLAFNARDAMPHGGTLTIETTNIAVREPLEEVRPGDYVQLSISDTGMGIPEEIRQKIFDPFFTTKPVGKGTGLGLSVVYGFIQQSQGNLRIESVVGKGTTVWILMPRYKALTTESVCA